MGSNTKIDNSNSKINLNEDDIRTGFEKLIVIPRNGKVCFCPNQQNNNETVADESERNYLDCLQEHKPKSNYIRNYEISNKTNNTGFGDGIGIDGISNVSVGHHSLRNSNGYGNVCHHNVNSFGEAGYVGNSLTRCNDDNETNVGAKLYGEWTNRFAKIIDSNCTNNECLNYDVTEADKKKNINEDNKIVDKDLMYRNALEAMFKVENVRLGEQINTNTVSSLNRTAVTKQLNNEKGNVVKSAFFKSYNVRNKAYQQHKKELKAAKIRFNIEKAEKEKELRLSWYKKINYENTYRVNAQSTLYPNYIENEKNIKKIFESEFDVGIGFLRICKDPEFAKKMFIESSGSKNKLMTNKNVVTDVKNDDNNTNEISLKASKLKKYSLDALRQLKENHPIIESIN